VRISKPQGDLRSLAWKVRIKASRRLQAGSPDEYDGDDFDWTRYHLEYSQQLEELESVHTLRLESEQWEWRDGSLNLTQGLPLHPNHKLLYETIRSLEPESVLEAGCGGGDHLHNLSMILPAVELRGVDRSEGQLGVLRRRNPTLASISRVVDLTLPHPVDMPKADLVFAQAVLMHIQTGHGHRVALWNMFDLATEQVVLMENLQRHDLIRDIQQLNRARIIPWERLCLYRSRHTAGPQILVASREPIALDLDEVPSA